MELTPYSVIDNYLMRVAKPWHKSPSEHVKTKEGRSTLRKFVDRVKSSYETALRGCGDDPNYLEYQIRLRWEYMMSYMFYSRDAPSETVETKEELIASLPYTLKTVDSAFPNDPYVEDPAFFDLLFNLRVSYRTFNMNDNEDLKLIYDKYKDLWVKRYVKYSKMLLSEAIRLWREIYLERIVSIVTEWKIHGINSDEDDIWDGEIPSDVVPESVQNSFENNDLYEMRMFHHDRAKDSLLFYGLLVGTRFASNVPSAENDFEAAKNDLHETAAKINDDIFHGDKGMEDLGIVANRYLRAEAANT